MAGVSQITNYVDIGDLCVGCYACAVVCPDEAIDMVADCHGFWYPEVDPSRCTECGRCRRVCPVLTPAETNSEPDAYACRAVDGSLRKESSSGGVFSLLARRVIDSGGVVFGAALDSTLDVLHERAEGEDALARLRGSKYVQSRVGDSYRQVRELLEAQRPVLFSGTHCQVAGLKAFLGREYAGLLCVDVVCHGVPSSHVWHRYIAFLEDKVDGKATAAAFRRKDEGWRAYSVAVRFDNGAQYRQSLRRDPYMRAFLSDICLRPSCYACRFKGLERASDITLGDFWGVEHVVPELDDDTGTSLVMVNSGAGRLAFDSIAGAIDKREASAEAAIRGNWAVVRSARANPKTTAFYRDLDRIRFDRLVRKYCSPGLLRRGRIRIARIIRRVFPARPR